MLYFCVTLSILDPNILIFMRTFELTRANGLITDTDQNIEKLPLPEEMMCICHLDDIRPFTRSRDNQCSGNKTQHVISLIRLPDFTIRLIKAANEVGTHL